MESALDLNWINWKYVLIPLISAFIGWLTNWVAVKMLFHPKQPINLGFFTLHGIFHQRQKEIAQKLGSTIESKLLNHSDIHDVLTSDKFLQNILPLVETYLDDFVNNRLKSIHPMLAMLPDSMVVMIKEKLMEEFSNFIPDVLEGAGDALQEHINVKEIIREKIEKFDVSELEDILFSILKSEFKMIELVGGVLGFFIGISQLLILHWT
ncbi:MAG: DUF445 domain-containing protein [SAR324 cluster bacterium]|uniref:DUF445 domain-containing protein n=1 Tax=SAR324 cluster bacterium TaxID=2024889 RepID=A0A2A4T0U9_9DELT|nr:MAG: DUF445 domain-containing protein [SAR324 cluster bacterium]